MVSLLRVILTLYPKFETLKNVERNYTCTSLPYDISYARDIWFVLCRCLEELLEIFFFRKFLLPTKTHYNAKVFNASNKWFFIFDPGVSEEFIMAKKKYTSRKVVEIMYDVLWYFFTFTFFLTLCTKYIELGRRNAQINYDKSWKNSKIFLKNQWIFWYVLSINVSITTLYFLEIRYINKNMFPSSSMSIYRNTWRRIHCAEDTLHVFNQLNSCVYV